MVKTFYDPEVEKRGILIGEERGEKKAEPKLKRQAIYELLEEVGVISEEAKNLIEAEGDLEILKKWHKFAARVNSIDEFVNKARLN